MTPQDIEAEIRAYIQRAKGIAADGLTLVEFAVLTVDLLKLAMKAVDSLPTEGAAKKEFVLQAVDLLFAGIADRLVPWPAIPLWLVAKPIVRQVVLAVASGVIEAILPMVRAGT
jgi:hypothetical protein